jgi:hypothetical protein
MSSQDPIGSTMPPERPTNPTHFGGAGLYESEADEPHSGEEASLKVPLSEHLSSTVEKSPESEQDSEQGSQNSLQEPVKRYNVLAWVAVAGIAWLLTALVRRSTERP